MSSQAVFVGNLCRDSELRTLQSGASVCNNCVAVNESYVDKKGEKQKRTSFINLEAWGFSAENLGGLKKGDKVIVIATPRFVAKENERGELVFNVVEIGVTPKSNGGGAKDTTKSVVKKTTKTKKVTKTEDDEPQLNEDEAPADETGGEKIPF